MWNEMEISEDVKKMLNKLCDRKRDMDSAKWWRSVYMLGTLGTMGLLFYYLSQTVLAQSGFNTLQILSRLADLKVMLMIGAAGFAAGQLNFYSKKYKTQKDKYEKLRVEAIERLYSPWVTSTLAKKRDIISKAMDKDYGINLSYIN